MNEKPDAKDLIIRKLIFSNMNMQYEDDTLKSCKSYIEFGGGIISHCGTEDESLSSVVEAIYEKIKSYYKKYEVNEHEE